MSFLANEALNCITWPRRSRVGQAI